MHLVSLSLDEAAPTGHVGGELPILDAPDRREICAGCGQPFAEPSPVWRWRLAGFSTHLGCRRYFERRGAITAEGRRHHLARQINDGQPCFRRGEVGEDCTWCGEPVLAVDVACFRPRGIVVDFDCLVAAVHAAGEGPPRRRAVADEARP